MSFILFFLPLLAICYAEGIKDDEVHHRLVNLMKMKHGEGGDVGSRIVGGRDAIRGQLPYLSLVYLAFEETSGQCSASLISPNYLLTAAHCLFRALLAVVGVGVLLKDDLHDDENNYVVFVDKEDLLPHPLYDEQSLIHDIGLIRLEDPVPRDKATPVLLPSMAHAAVDTFAGHAATIAGWGRTSDNEDEAAGSSSLKYAGVVLTRQEECRSFYRPVLEIFNSQLCTSYNGSATCNGDSGGPLVVRMAGRDVVVGITSFGTKLCQQAAPSVYTNVASYLPWLAKHLKLSPCINSNI